MTGSIPPATDAHLRTAGALAGMLLIAQFVLLWVTFYVLSTAIGWPASLRDPAAVTLPRLVANEGAVRLGYGLYLLGAILLVPAAAALNARLGLTGAVAGLSLALAALAAMAKAIGIGRWLFAMPGLAHAYVAPGSDQPAITMMFGMLNSYAGGIGEVVGVALMSGAWTFAAAWGLARSPGRTPKVLAGFAALAAFVLVATVPSGFGVPMGPVLTVSSVLWQLTLFAVALWAFTAPRRLV